MRNSKTENEFREEINRNQIYLAQTSNLTNFLQSLGYDIADAQVIEAFPEQNSMIFTVLLNRETVLKIEISNSDKSDCEVLERLSLKEFKVGLSQSGQIKLAVGLSEISDKT